MTRVLLSKGKERAKAKIKAGQKANAAKPAKFSLYDTQVRYANGKPVVTAVIKKAAAPVKKVASKKVEVKKVKTKKVETKKPAAKPINKELLNKMTRTGQAYYLNTKTGKLEKTPTVNEIVKKVADTKKKTTPAKKGATTKPKRTGNSFLDVATGAVPDDFYTVKPKSTTPKVTTPAKTSTPSVSELWKQKTGTSWSEAKKQGLTDGSAAANIALMKKLKSGSINKNTIKSDKAARNMEPFKKLMEQNIQDELSGKIKFDEPVATMRRGGSVRKMRKGSITKRKK
jgi:hypothetical protein